MAPPAAALRALLLTSFRPQGSRKFGPVTTAPDQTAQTSTVYYDTGAKAAGDEVATTLGLSSAAVMPIDQNIRVLGQNAIVVVVLGADQAQ